MNRFDLLLHPIRMRIVMATSGQVVTAQQLAAQLSDVAQTTLYRHINALIKGGILEIVSETKIRGTVERELQIATDVARVDPETIAQLPHEQQVTYFTTFISLLLGEFEQAKANPVPNFPLAYYGKNKVYASAEELLEINARMDGLLADYSNPQRTPQTGQLQSWLFTGIIMPDGQQSDEETDE